MGLDVGSCFSSGYDIVNLSTCFSYTLSFCGASSGILSNFNSGEFFVRSMALCIVNCGSMVGSTYASKSREAAVLYSEPGILKASRFPRRLAAKSRAAASGSNVIFFGSF